MNSHRLFGRPSIHCLRRSLPTNITNHNNFTSTVRITYGRAACMLAGKRLSHSHIHWPRAKTNMIFTLMKCKWTSRMDGKFRVCLFQWCFVFFFFYSIEPISAFTCTAAMNANNRMCFSSVWVNRMVNAAVSTRTTYASVWARIAFHAAESSCTFCSTKWNMFSVSVSGGEQLLLLWLDGERCSWKFVALKIVLHYQFNVCFIHKAQAYDCWRWSGF